MTLLWFWLGGVVGQLALTAVNEDTGRALKRAVYRAGWSAAIGYLLGVLLWPLSTLVLLFFGEKAYHLLDKQEEIRDLPVVCPVCGIQEKIRISRERWLQDPPYWFGDSKTGEIACSYRCARHLEGHLDAAFPGEQQDRDVE